MNDSKVTAEIRGFGKIFWWRGTKKEKCVDTLEINEIPEVLNVRIYLEIFLS